LKCAEEFEEVMCRYSLEKASTSHTAIPYGEVLFYVSTRVFLFCLIDTLFTGWSILEADSSCLVFVRLKEDAVMSKIRKLTRRLFL
jgi:hypothetical protein